MNLLVRLSVAGAVGILMAACGPSEEPVQLTAPQETARAADAPVAPQVPAVDKLSRDFREDKYNTMTGELVEGQLVNNGKGGFLLFGPYVPFQAGTYSVSFVGNVGELATGKKVRIDVVSNKGKMSHTMTEVDVVGSIPSFEFTLVESVPDLEVRVLAPEDTRVSLESYQVDRIR